MRFTIYQDTRQGGRSNNEDRLAYSYSRDALLLVIADGMGGHYYGEIAAQIAVQTLVDTFQREAKQSLPDPFRFLQRAIIASHQAILEYSAKHQLPDSPRTTIVACVIQDSIAYWAHAGDSRLYLARNGRVIAQTRDHSNVRRLIDDCTISEAQAATHPDRNKIYSCLGSPQSPEIEFSRKTPLESGDMLILCTDGVWSVISGDTMALALKGANLMQSVPMMIKQAEQKGGPNGDNLSIITLRWEESYTEEDHSAISTQAMLAGDVTTRLDEFGRNPAFKTDLSDDEIEKAIRDIRSAIDKYSNRK
ncbi:MAG: hypothetical protein RIR00_1296 [Pseudomonadota bacterium]|jgi:serine/threonine protein phosphatase PrpC